MYKIITDITQLEIINSKVQELENNSSSKYCETVKHPFQNKWAIPILEGILRGYNIDFMTDSWFNTDIIEELPEDWLWPYLNRTYRVKIPYQLQAKAIRTKNKNKDDYKLKLLIEVLNANLPEEYSFYDSDYIITYLEEIYSTFSSCGNDETDLEVLQMFDEIIIEHYEILTKQIKKY
jgi:hypothetical protein